jgi:RNA polymerase sigma-70 factor (ECF subfamily)
VAASDEALLAGLGAGDPEAAVAFIRRFQARVFGLALTIVGDPSLAEDIAQQSFVRAWQHADAYDARRGSVAAWLLTISRNQAIDAARARRSVPTDPDAIVALMGSTGEDASDGALSHPGDSAALLGAVRLLPEEQRRAVVLAAVAGRTAQEVADAEGIPLGTAKTRIRTALLKLRGALAAEGTT